MQEMTISNSYLLLVARLVNTALDRFNANQVPNRDSQLMLSNLMD